MSEDIKDALDSVNKVVHELRTHVEETSKQTRADVLDEIKKANIEQGFIEIRARQDEIEKSLKRAAALAAPNTEDEQTRAENAAWRTWTRTGEITDGLRDLDRNGEVFTRAANMNTLASADGGALVPPAVLQMLDRLSLVISPMRQLATVMPTGGPLSFPISKRGAGTGWVAENAARPSTTTPDLTLFTPPIGELYANPQVTQTMLDDGYINIEQFIAEELADAFAYAEGAAFWNGTGTNQPKGIYAETFTDQTAELSDPASGIGQWKTGVAADFAATNPLDLFKRVQASLKPAYRANASWAVNRQTEAFMATVKDTTGNYIWKQAVAEGNFNTFLGSRVVIDDTVESVGSGKKPVIYGDFKKYVIVDRFGVRQLRDPYSNKPYIGFYTTKRVGGGVKMQEAFKAIVCKV